MKTKKVGVGISEEAHTILTDYQKEKGLSTLDDALDTFLKEKGAQDVSVEGIEKGKKGGQ